MRTYPEWFIGGPWHGRDKTKVCPHLQSMVRVASVAPPTLEIFGLGSRLEEPSPVEIPSMTVEEYIYVPKSADVFGERVTVWVGERDVATPYSESGGIAEWVAMFGQLIMSPHRTDVREPGFDVSNYAERHRQRYEIEREVRAQLNREHENEILRLRQRINFLSHVSPRPHPLAPPSRTQDELANEKTDSGVISIKVNDRLHSAKFTDISIYEDPGDEENAPGWIATAQTLVREDDGDTASVGFTGYGPNPVGAVMALLADKLGYYARLTDYGTEGRIR